MINSTYKIKSDNFVSVVAVHQGFSSTGIKYYIVCLRECKHCKKKKNKKINETMIKQTHL